MDEPHESNMFGLGAFDDGWKFYRQFEPTLVVDGIEFRALVNALDAAGFTNWTIRRIPDDGALVMYEGDRVNNADPTMTYPDWNPVMKLELRQGGSTKNGGGGA
jgi:hypothetical protein